MTLSEEDRMPNVLRDDCELARAPDDGRLEYQMLTRHMAAVVGFRFQTLGLFLGGRRVPRPGRREVRSRPTRRDRDRPWVVELKTSALLAVLGRQGRSFETYLEAAGPFRAQNPSESNTDETYRTVQLPFGRSVRSPIAPSHTLGIDLVYLAVAVWAGGVFLGVWRG